jgi:hypothetical protein
VAHKRNRSTPAANQSDQEAQSFSFEEAFLSVAIDRFNMQNQATNYDLEASHGVHAAVFLCVAR